MNFYYLILLAQLAFAGPNPIKNANWFADSDTGEAKIITLEELTARPNAFFGTTQVSELVSTIQTQYGSRAVVVVGPTGTISFWESEKIFNEWLHLYNLGHYSWNTSQEFFAEFELSKQISGLTENAYTMLKKSIELGEVRQYQDYIRFTKEVRKRRGNGPHTNQNIVDHIAQHKYHVDYDRLGRSKKAEIDDIFRMINDLISKNNQELFKIPYIKLWSKTNGSVYDPGLISGRALNVFARISFLENLLSLRSKKRLGEFLSKKNLLILATHPNLLENAHVLSSLNLDLKDDAIDEFDNFAIHSKPLTVKENPDHTVEGLHYRIERPLGSDQSRIVITLSEDLEDDTPLQPHELEEIANKLSESWKKMMPGSPNPFLKTSEMINKQTYHTELIIPDKFFNSMVTFLSKVEKLAMARPDRNFIKALKEQVKGKTCPTIIKPFL